VKVGTAVLLVVLAASLYVPTFLLTAVRASDLGMAEYYVRISRLIVQSMKSDADTYVFVNCVRTVLRGREVKERGGKMSTPNILKQSKPSRSIKVTAPDKG
jgi:hypothetical protein